MRGINFNIIFICVFFVFRLLSVTYCPTNFQIAHYSAHCQISLSRLTPSLSFGNSCPRFAVPMVTMIQLYPFNSLRQESCLTLNRLNPKPNSLWIDLAIFSRPTLANFKINSKSKRINFLFFLFRLNFTFLSSFCFKIYLLT